VASSSYAQQRAKERIADVARQGHDLVTFWREATDAIAPVVPFYLTPCFYTIDPASLLATSHYHDGLPEIPREWLAVEYYDDQGQPGPHPTFLQFPADRLLRGQRILVVDEVWDSGTTIHAVTERVRQAGGIPTTVVLHYKPTHSVVPGSPDIHAVETDAWVVYPFKAGD